MTSRVRKPRVGVSDALRRSYLASRMGHDNDSDEQKQRGGGDASTGVALLLIDVINDMEFGPGDAGRRLCANYDPVSRRLVDFRGRCRAAGVPVVYVNDNFGRWKSDFQAVVRRCCDEEVCGAEVSSRLRPGEEDYFVLKPRNSGFYGTSLEPLLEHLGVDTLILAGVAGNNCVLFTAHDAYLRGYRVVVPGDGIADEDAASTERALEQMRQVIKADTTPLAELDPDRLRSGVGVAKAIGESK